MQFGHSDLVPLMDGKSKPNFAAWSNENLARFAAEAFDDMVGKAEQIEALELDNKLLLQTLRDLWKEGAK